MYGIVGYGAYVPCYRIRTAEIAAQWGHASDGQGGKGLVEKTVPGLDEDTITISVARADDQKMVAAVGIRILPSRRRCHSHPPVNPARFRPLRIGRELRINFQISPDR